MTELILIVDHWMNLFSFFNFITNVLRSTSQILSAEESGHVTVARRSLGRKAGGAEMLVEETCRRAERRVCVVVCCANCSLPVLIFFNSLQVFFSLDFFFHFTLT